MLASPRANYLTQLIEAASRDARLGALRIEKLPQKNWVAEAESLRGPVRAGRFLVHGRHDRGKVPAGRFTLEIDAGLAFGTAHHATTRGCLIALDRLAKREHLRSVLDIGTGTGILAIAAARTLNANVIASDMDPIAVAVAGENARTNGVQSRVAVVEAEGVAHPALRGAKADLLFANILLSPLLDLAPAFARALRPGGTLRALRPSRSPSAAGGIALPVARLHARFANPSRRMDHPAAAAWQRAVRVCGLIAAEPGLTRRTMFQSFEEISSSAAVPERVAALRRELKSRKLKGFLVPHSDEHQDEFLPSLRRALALAHRLHRLGRGGHRAGERSGAVR